MDSVLPLPSCIPQNYPKLFVRKKKDPNPQVSHIVWATFRLLCKGSNAIRPIWLTFRSQKHIVPTLNRYVKSTKINTYLTFPLRIVQLLHIVRRTYVVHSVGLSQKKENFQLEAKVFT